MLDLLRFSDCLIGKTTGGAITNRYGYVWVSTPGFQDNAKELQQINLESCFNPNSIERTFGIYFQSDLYLFTTCTDDTVIAENLDHLICISKCKNCFVFGFANEDSLLKDCIEAVTGLADELRNCDLDFFPK
ncbi:hypothetical protein M9Y10_009788 [Tritrichomonas musculus]|uniref:Profilin n=1 Tax=Tritrichomonas musculus TaxID=1915356 RepID=A0ABR2IQI2_9EUKA